MSQFELDQTLSVDRMYPASLDLQLSYPCTASHPSTSHTRCCQICCSEPWAWSVHVSTTATPPSVTSTVFNVFTSHSTVR